MPQDYVFNGKRDQIAKGIDRDLALNTRGPIRPVRESDLGNFSDFAIAKGALGGRHTTGKLPERRRAGNYPPDNTEQVPPTQFKRLEKKPRRPFRPLKRETSSRKAGR